MTTSYDCTSEDQRANALEHAQRAIAEKKCIVFPTDTVYGIAADAFSPQAVTMLLVSKGRGRQMPPPVLIPRLNALDGLATDIPAEARRLAEKFWPGGLTMILHAQPSLDWDLGETKGTVALRMPDDDIALEVLTLTGPLAVSSANRTGQPAARTAAEAYGQLAESVEVYLEGGERPASGSEALASTIVDATANPMRVVREGAISLERLREVVPEILGINEVPEARESGLQEPAAGEPEAETGAEIAPTDPASEADDPADSEPRTT
ncbi:L-threonylcarbamoyladenylate synthase [Pseudarthrobacter sp. J75]|uniref:L-threonylcarbamoyladenylate synthase n=1 Tax=unclassified Pseudarthrobacter TaxID=2647000 RepID=UPI002E7FC8D1|nr:MULTISPECIES: L-threonylcarbamoyladenylate synthase [unclassified Pseudarthrobacter]MEE2521461.1 L-threonylcarbamoyladenylate synthase [Pseudarthrobacter sp. J47]MEE2528693.1 L-threonylcarbamoyladenylate synthase [Pseudarthrobacter sp. J75]MEE2568385.1 L-threonylcarbamoyladenylate synthase [Pseudarthrobacter sp. J64]